MVGKLTDWEARAYAAAFEAELFRRYPRWRRHAAPRGDACSPRITFDLSIPSRNPYVLQPLRIYIQDGDWFNLTWLNQNSFDVYRWKPDLSDEALIRQQLDFLDRFISEAAVFTQVRQGDKLSLGGHMSASPLVVPSYIQRMAPCVLIVRSWLGTHDCEITVT